MPRAAEISICHILALLPTGELGNLHDLYDVTADGILPEELMFAPDPVPHP
jgi:hypothetical protein